MLEELRIRILLSEIQKFGSGGVWGVEGFRLGLGRSKISDVRDVRYLILEPHRAKDSK